ncbi:MAG: hypothetical protein NC342_01140, partial [Pseudoflavonifractor sp.]|nr:hypothetical protein [Pseudoflavonifractor sp.]
MTYIILLILIFFAAPYIFKLLYRLIVWWATRRIARQTQRAYEDIFGRAAADAADDSRSTRRGEPDG